MSWSEGPTVQISPPSLEPRRFILHSKVFFPRTNKAFVHDRNLLQPFANSASIIHSFLGRK